MVKSDVGNMENLEESLQLGALKAGDCAVIKAIDNEQDMERLKSMGVCEGRVIELIRNGNPLIIKVFGSRIGMSARLAKHIEVERRDNTGRCWARCDNSKDGEA